MLLSRIILLLFLSLILSGMLFVLIYALRRNFQPKSKEGAKLQDAGVRDLIIEGRIDEAIEIYRRFTGIDEIAARKYVEDMAREIRLSDETYQAVQHLLKNEGKAAAIEAYQAQTGADLADALAYVESVEREKK